MHNRAKCHRNGVKMATSFPKIKITKQISMCEVQTSLVLGLKPVFLKQTPGYAPDRDIKFT